MKFKRIIPCLDFFNGRIIKGVNFKNLIDIGNPIDVANFYNDEGADEIVFLDISASIENKNQTYDFINSISSKISIPLTVGGGVKSYKDFENLFNSGADKISLNSYIIDNCNFIQDIKYKYGSQCIVAALDIKKFFKNKFFYFWNVYKISGKNNTNLNLKDLLLKFVKLGIGEVLLTSIDMDGTKTGFDKELFNKISNVMNLSIIASGGGGDLNSLLNIFKIKNIESILLASILHKKMYTIKLIKDFLINNGIQTRIK